MNTNLNKQTSVRFFNILQASSAQVFDAVLFQFSDKLCTEKE